MVGENSELPVMLIVHQPFFLAKKQNWEVIFFYLSLYTPQKNVVEEMFLSIFLWLLIWINFT